MNISSLAGLILGFGMFIVGVLTSGGVQMFGNFWDVPSLFITIGGSLAGCYDVKSDAGLHQWIEGF